MENNDNKANIFCPKNKETCGYYDIDLKLCKSESTIGECPND